MISVVIFMPQAYIEVDVITASGIYEAVIRQQPTTSPSDEGRRNKEEIMNNNEQDNVNGKRNQTGISCVSSLDPMEIALTRIPLLL